MKTSSPNPAPDPQDEIVALVRTLHETQQRLQELAGGEVDAVVHPGGPSYLLPAAQEKLRQSEAAQRELAATQLAILDALPAQIALLDQEGTIISVNDGWRRFASEDALQGGGTRPGQNYLEVCERSHGSCAEKAHAVAAGIRAVLTGATRRFALEYPCHSPSEQRWFRLMVSPIEHPTRPGAVVMHVDITERKLAEEALLESEGRFRGTFEQAAVGLAHVSTEGRFLRVNDKLCSIVGYPREELLGLTFLELTLPEDRAAGLEARRSMLAGETSSFTAEKRYRHKGGELVWINLVTTLERTAAGQPKYFISVFEDITPRKLAESALRTSEERFQAFMAHSPAAGWIVDREGCFRYVSPGYYRMFGVPGDLTGRRISDLYEPAVAEEYLANNRRALDEQCAVEVVESGRRSDGSPGEFLAVKFPIEVPGGELLLGGLALDITERKRTEQRMRRLVESNVQGVFFWQAEGRIVEANDAFLRLTGYTREDLAAGRLNWRKMTPPEGAARDQQAAEELRGLGICAPYEKEYLRPDGTRVPVLVGRATFTDTPEEGVAFVLDLTERKKLEQQFLRAQRMESIGTLAGGIAHDLNNVLGPIIMALDLFQMRFPDPASQELIGIISSSARRGADMVSQVLSFARGVEGRRLELQVRHLVRDIEKIANDTFLKNIRVRAAVPQDLWTVIGDPTQLHQVLLNLCVNARDAMPEGGALTISANNLTIDTQYAGLNLEARPGPYVVLHVEDTGTGIPPAIVEKIFDPFFTTKDLGQGTGLGLSTSLAIVKSHGGFLRVYSEPGRGTKFRVYLPALPEASPETAAALAAEMPRGQGELILVVDDEVSVRQITQQTLEAFGYRAILASDGAEAIATYAGRGAEIAVLLTDMMMPGIDGPATIQVLRKMNPQLPVIAASGLSTESQVAKVRALGVKHFLPKPYTAETLLKILHEIL